MHEIDSTKQNTNFKIYFNLFFNFMSIDHLEIKVETFKQF